MKVPVERRKSKRFRVHRGAIVMLSPSDTCMGQIIDIGMDGLAFECVSSEEPLSRPNRLEIFVNSSTFSLKGLPCQIVYDLTTYQSALSSCNKKRYGVKFGSLTSDQRLQIKHFIENHTVDEVKFDNRMRVPLSNN